MQILANMTNEINPMTITAGAAISSGRPFYRHVGIFAGLNAHGVPTVISNSGHHGMVIEETLDQFRAGGDLKVEGYWGTLPPQQVLARARAKLGSKYLLFNWNCEHFARYAHGLKEESPQIAVASSLIGIALLIGISRA